MATIITGQVYLDAGYTRALPTPVGPFAGSTEAREFMDSLGPLWGSWGIENLGSTDIAAYGIVPTSPESLPPRYSDPGRCVRCRHAEHDGFACLNMQSDNDCACPSSPDSETTGEQ